MSWRVDLIPQPDRTLHIWPDADVFQHDINHGSACLCGPALAEASGRVLVTHHSLDGREASET